MISLVPSCDKCRRTFESESGGSGTQIHNGSKIRSTIKGVRDRLKMDGWTRDRLGYDYCPECTEKKKRTCRGHRNGNTGPPCCKKAGKYNGYGSDGPTIFTCPKSCSCHD